jgi:hypothetical protein
MPLSVRAWIGGGEFPQHGPAFPQLPAAAARDVPFAISRLEHGDLFGKVGGINRLQNERGGWRIDRQNAPSGYINISVQRNGADSPSTVASVFIPDGLNISAPRPGTDQTAYLARVRELQRQARHGLENSFASFLVTATANHRGVVIPTTARITRFQVFGNFSS